MCNPGEIRVDPDTAVQEASGDNNEQTQNEDSIVTNINITTNALFICLIFGIFVFVIVLYFLHKVNIRKLDRRLHTLAHLTGFGEEHIQQQPSENREQFELQNMQK